MRSGAQLGGHLQDDAILPHRIFGRSYAVGSVFMFGSIFFPGEARPRGDAMMVLLGVVTTLLACFELRAHEALLRRGELVILTITPWVIAASIYSSTIDEAAAWSLPMLVLPFVVGSGYFSFWRLAWMSGHTMAVATLLIRMSTSPAVGAAGDDVEAMLAFGFSIVVSTIGGWRLAESRRHLAEQLQRLASTDSLTGLLNRRAFIEATDALRLTESDRTHVVLLDIDHFKSVNDRFGHETGDEVLRKLAGPLVSSFGDGAIVGRMGGEEFAVATTKPTAEVVRGLQRMARQLRSLHPVPVTMSAGIAQPQPLSALHALLRDADVLLYKAKHAGRNCVVTQINHQQVAIRLDEAQYLQPSTPQPTAHPYAAPHAHVSSLTGQG
jgi:diguanylate cyclase (GGDEF)-like protein